MARAIITVGVDGSPASDAALLYALDEAVLRMAEVQAVTAYWVGPVLDEHHGATTRMRRAQAQAVSAAAILRAQMELDGPPVVVPLIVHSEPSSALIEAARHSLCLVIGTEHKGLLRRVTEGSVSTQCVRNCAVPVLVVPWCPQPVAGASDLEAGSAAGRDSELAVSSNGTARATGSPV